MTAGPQQIIPSAFLLPLPIIYSTNQQICYRIKTFVVTFLKQHIKIPLYLSPICIDIKVTIIYECYQRHINYFSNIKPYSLLHSQGQARLTSWKCQPFICNFPNNDRLHLIVILNRNNTYDMLEICMIHKALSSGVQIQYGISFLAFCIVRQ